MTILLDGMPVLQDYCELLPGHLTGINILYINHIISDSLMVARGLHYSGATLWSVGIPYGDVSSPTRRSIIAGLEALGPTVVPKVSEPLSFADAMSQAVRKALKEIIQASIDADRKFMIVEDGGYAFPLLHDVPELSHGLEHCIGAVEHTSRGLWNYQYEEADDIGRTHRILHRPAVSIATSVLKAKHEPPFVAQGVIDELCFLLRKRHEFLRYRNVGVIGCGRVGVGLALLLDALESKVFAVETDASRADAVRQEHPNLRILPSLNDTAVANADLILGASGLPSFSDDNIRAFLLGPRSSLSLASASSKVIEYAQVMSLLDAAVADPDLLEHDIGVQATVKRDRISEFGIDYLIESPSFRKRLTIIADGYPTIFFPGHTNGAPNRSMDPIMTELYLAACLLRTHAPTMSPVVHTLDMLTDLPDSENPWMDLMYEARILERWCAHNEIDYQTYSRQLGIHDSSSTLK